MSEHSARSVSSKIRPCELERARVVVREHLRMILETAVRLDPPRGAGVLFDPARPPDLPVRDVAQQHVQERVLRLPGHRGAALAADELLALERVEPPCSRSPPSAATAPGQNTLPITAASWSSRFSSAGSASSRAPMIPCTDSGSGSSSASPRSASICAYCSA